MRRFLNRLWHWYDNTAQRYILLILLNTLVRDPKPNISWKGICFESFWAEGPQHFRVECKLFYVRGRGSFQSKNLCCRFWTFKQGFLICFSENCNMIFRYWGGESKAEQKIHLIGYHHPFLSQRAPSISIISNDSKRIWTILNELK